MYNLTTPHLIRNGISKWGISHWNEEYIIKTDGDRHTDATPYGRPVSKHTSCTYKEFFNEKEISQDDLRRGEEIIQNLTDNYITKIDLLLEKKEKDLLEI